VTPLAEFVFNHPFDRSFQSWHRHLLAGAEYFVGNGLWPIIEVRGRAPDRHMAVRELLDGHLLAERMWFEFDGDKAIMLGPPDFAHPDTLLAETNLGEKLLYAGAIVSRIADEATSQRFVVGVDGMVGSPPVRPLINSPDLARNASGWLSSLWFAIEASQTKGMTHKVVHEATRQQRRAAVRSGRPSHRWIEIKLGSERLTSRGNALGASAGVCWHYRRGHAVNHSNPNYPKWRKGGWVGDPAIGINTHTYVLDQSE
jgi:hypothetical protein